MDAARLELRERSTQFVEQLKRDPPLRIPGTAVVLGRMAKGVPDACRWRRTCGRRRPGRARGGHQFHSLSFFAAVPNWPSW
jgi:hypothetical protein